jgi:hypothetical protein
MTELQRAEANIAQARERRNAAHERCAEAERAVGATARRVHNPPAGITGAELAEAMALLPALERQQADAHAALSKADQALAAAQSAKTQLQQRAAELRAIIRDTPAARRYAAGNLAAAEEAVRAAERERDRARREVAEFDARAASAAAELRRIEGVAAHELTKAAA